MSEVKSFVTAIKAAESTTKKEPKVQALSLLDDIGQRLVHEALNPYRVFGVKKYPKPKAYAAEDGSITPFLDLMDDLHERELTGNAARDKITAVLSSFTEDTATYLARVLNKDLKAGFSETTVNKIFAGLVPVFDVMLASKVDAKYKWPFPIQAEYKMDGTRLIAITENGITSYFSRSGKPSDFCNGLFDEELADLEKYVGQPIVVDGEALGDNFTETLNAKSSDNDAAKAKLRFFAFDYMTLDEWKAQQGTKVQKTRTAELKNMIEIRGYKKIVKSKTLLCHNMDEVTAFYRQALDDHFEGLILKDPEALYEWGRSKAWYKWKPVFDFDLKVVGIYEGREGTKNEGRMGGFELEGTDENGNFIRTNCGSLQVGKKGEWLDTYIAKLAAEEGVDLNEVSNDEFFRTYVWKNKEKFIGRTAQVEAQELSKSEASEDYSLRFPVLVMFRDDRKEDF